MASSFSNKEVFQVQEGKGIQDEKELTKTNFPNPNVQRFQLQRGVLNTLGHLIPSQSALSLSAAPIPF